MLAIGLTGGIGTGKSTISAILSELGAEVVDADKVGWEVYSPGSAGFDAVVAAFGEEIVDITGQIDRKALGQRVFGDAAQMRRLTSIVWPLIGDKVRERLDENRLRGVEVTVVEAAVLLEAQWDRMFDEVWVVTSSRGAIGRRLAARNGISPADVEARVAAQMPDDERELRADAIIKNDGDLDALRLAIDKLWRERTMNGRHN
jgi:dephospho-CoA kinase